MIFDDRASAGRKLAHTVAAANLDSPIVLALPRGGVPVAFQIATGLAAPLDLMLVRKLGAPGHPEYAMGAIAGSPPQTVFNREALAVFRPTEGEIERELSRQTAELERRRVRYLGNRRPLSVEQRTVILVDDGVATGSTAEAALRALRQMGAQSILFTVPVGASAALLRLGALCDDVVCLSSVHNFVAVGQHYRDFEQVSDDEVIELLEQAGAGRSSQTPNG